MATYLIRHTDPANGSFVIPDNQINGTTRPWNAALYVNPVSGVTALSSSTSLVLPGRGVTDYGELLANDLVHAMEHFAYATRPLTPSQGQIWYKNANGPDLSYPSDPTISGLYLWSGTAWMPILATVGGFINAGGNVVTNVGNAVGPTDAINQQTGDARYVLDAGDTMTGLLVLSADPVAALGAATKQYVDNTTVSITGDTMTGTLFIDQNADVQLVAGGTGLFNGGTRRLQNIGTPTANQDAATKLYVDNAIAGFTPPPSSNTFTTSVLFNSALGELTLTRNDSVVLTTGPNSIAPFLHSHTATQVTYDMTVDYSQSILRGTLQDTVGYPTINAANAIRTIDQELQGLKRRPRRRMFVANGTTTSFSLGADNFFQCGENRIQVFVDGVKQYENERGRATVAYDNAPISPDTPLGLSGSYAFDITVDGTLFAGQTINATTTAVRAFSGLVGGTGYVNGTYTNVPLTGGAGTGATANITVAGGVVTLVEVLLRGTGYVVGNTLSTAAVNLGGTGSGFTINVAILSGVYTFYDLLTDLQALFDTTSIPVSILFDQFYQTILMHFESPTTGAGSSVTLSSAAGQLFAFPAPVISFQRSAPTNSAVTSNYSYFESQTGVNVKPLTVIDQITFNTAPIAGSVIEVLVFSAG